MQMVESPTRDLPQDKNFQRILSPETLSPPEIPHYKIYSTIYIFICGYKGGGLVHDISGPAQDV